MKALIMMTFAGILLYYSFSFADTQTTTSITNTPASNVINNNGAETSQSSTIITTVTKDTSTPTPADDKIVSAVYAKFSKTSALIGTNLTVTSLNGIVTIEGIVTSQSQADAAVEAAKSIKGVDDVRSNITVTTNPDLNKGHPAPRY